MRYSTKKLLRSVAPLAALVLAFGITTDAYAQTGSCSAAIAEVNLDVNNVRAAIFANGNLFWRGGNAIYEVPKGGGVQAIFTGGIWIGGTVGGQLRTAAARYGNYEFWAGPVEDNGGPPQNCSPYDRVWNVRRSDVEAYKKGVTATEDLMSWPTGLGAPTLDANGEPIDVMQTPLAERVDRVIDLGLIVGLPAHAGSGLGTRLAGPRNLPEDRLPRQYSDCVFQQPARFPRRRFRVVAKRRR